MAKTTQTKLYFRKRSFVKFIKIAFSRKKISAKIPTSKVAINLLQIPLENIIKLKSNKLH